MLSSKECTVAQEQPASASCAPDQAQLLNCTGLRVRCERGIRPYVRFLGFASAISASSFALGLERSIGCGMCAFGYKNLCVPDFEVLAASF